jgi:hypothetical protein
MTIETLSSGKGWIRMSQVSISEREKVFLIQNLGPALTRVSTIVTEQPPLLSNVIRSLSSPDSSPEVPLNHSSVWARVGDGLVCPIADENRKPRANVVKIRIIALVPDADFAADDLESQPHNSPTVNLPQDSLSLLFNTLRFQSRRVSRLFC